MANVATRENRPQTPRWQGLPADHGEDLTERPKKIWLRRGLIGCSLLAAAGLIALGAVTLGGSLQSDRSRPMLTHTVQRGELLVTVTEDGNLESASNVDIRCQVAGGSSILWIVNDGQEVQQGDELVHLDGSQIEEQINQQRIVYEKARAARIQAETDHAVAKLAVQEYLDGTYRKELQDLQAQVTISLENLRSAQNAVNHSQRMFRKGYISSLELESHQFAVERADLELQSAQTATEVLEKFTKVKMLQELLSQRDSAEARMESEKAAFDLEELRLRRLEAQLASCVIAAPQDGMVVYANETGSRGQQGVQIEEGAMVRERQTILRLPDLSKMQVKVNVHESKVESLKRGMRARVRIQDRELQGTVIAIANQPEPTSWHSAAVKEYATIVKIDGQPQGLKPGMTAEVEILVAHLQDVLTLPVAAVVEQRREFFCWVQTPEKIERRPLVLGPSNDRFIAVLDGVSEGERVLLNPRAIMADARRDTSEPDPVDVEGRFGVPQPRQFPQDAGEPPAPQFPAASGAGGEAQFESADWVNEAPDRRGMPRSAQDGDATPYDRDGEGGISREEAPEHLQPIFDRLDLNGDDYLDRNETRATQDQRPRD